MFSSPIRLTTSASVWWSRLCFYETFGVGLFLLSTRLERGRFVWPQARSGTVALTRAQLSMLLEGIDWRRPERTWDPHAVV
jgi:transposase